MASYYSPPGSGGSHLPQLHLLLLLRGSFLSSAPKLYKAMKTAATRPQRPKVTALLQTWSNSFPRHCLPFQAHFSNLKVGDVVVHLSLDVDFWVGDWDWRWRGWNCWAKTIWEYRICVRDLMKVGWNNEMVQDSTSNTLQRMTWHLEVQKVFGPSICLYMQR